MKLSELLKLTKEKGASDLHLSAGVEPKIRVDGTLHSLQENKLSEKEIYELIVSILNNSQIEQLKKKIDLDFALSIPKLGRFRVNTFHQERGYAASFRPISNDIPSIESLALPSVLKSLCEFPHGLILITGPTGSGKSTTLASLINEMNRNQALHIITIEDPIEYLYTSEKSLINQRELGQDTHSFSTALRSALREDPDVILLGEMRDVETIRLALTAAETGHLVFATLHTSSAPQTINRIVDVFPGEEKDMIRTMLAESLRAVISQTLISRANGSGRIPALEIMICTPAIKNLIRENKSAQIYSAIQTGAKYGMQTLDQYLEQLLKQNIITTQVANEVSSYQIKKD